MTSPMPSAHLHTIVEYSNTLLKHPEINDWSAARNGLQIENSGTISHLYAAVDVSLPVLRAASQKKQSLLLVHHGLFWNDIAPLTGANYQKVKLCLEGDIALYGSHLPLDAHPLYGNTAGLASALGLADGIPWFEEKGTYVGQKFTVDFDRHALVKNLEEATGISAHLIAAGPTRIRSLGIVTGGAGAEAARAAASGIDTFLTGEGPHWTHALAHDLGINIIYGGHYATETFGVKALAAHLAKKFNLSWEFLDYPTGL